MREDLLFPLLVSDAIVVDICLSKTCILFSAYLQLSYHHAAFKSLVLLVWPWYSLSTVKQLFMCPSLHSAIRDFLVQ